NLSNAGVITGTPTAAGVFSFTITATDSIGASDSKPFGVTINSAVSITTASPLTTWTAGLANYNQTLAATGGTGAITFGLATGSTLPPGLNLSKVSLPPKARSSVPFEGSVQCKNCIAVKKERVEEVIGRIASHGSRVADTHNLGGRQT